MAGNAYSDGKTKPQIRDFVYGKTPVGHPVSGIVHDIDVANGKVRVCPQVLVDQWVNTSDMTPTPGAAKT